MTLSLLLLTSQYICNFAFVFVREAYQLISIYKKNYRTYIVNFFFLGGALIGEGRLLEIVTCFESLTFWKALFRYGCLLETGRSLDHLRYFIESTH